MCKYFDVRPAALLEMHCVHAAVVLDGPSLLTEAIAKIVNSTIHLDKSK